MRAGTGYRWRVTRFLTLAVGTVGASLALLAGAPAAQADAVDDAVDALRSGSVYVAPGVDAPTIDEAAVRAAIGTRAVKVAVLPADQYGTNADTYTAAESIGRTLAPDSPLTVAVIAGRSVNASSSALCAGTSERPTRPRIWYS